MKFKSIYRFDFTNEGAAQDLFWTLTRKGFNGKDAKEEVRKKYGFGTVHIVSANFENACRKFHRLYPNAVYMTTETILCGAIF